MHKMKLSGKCLPSQHWLLFMLERVSSDGWSVSGLHYACGTLSLAISRFLCLNFDNCENYCILWLLMVDWEQRQLCPRQASLAQCIEDAFSGRPAEKQLISVGELHNHCTEAVVPHTTSHTTQSQTHNIVLRLIKLGTDRHTPPKCLSLLVTRIKDEHFKILLNVDDVSQDWDPVLS